MNRYLIGAATAAVIATLGACAGDGNRSMNAGESIQQRGSEIAQYGADWKSGNKAVREGQKLDAESTDQIDKARRQLADAEADRTRARQMIADGTVAMQRSEAEYAATRAGPPATPAPPQ